MSLRKTTNENSCPLRLLNKLHPDYSAINTILQVYFAIPSLRSLITEAKNGTSSSLINNINVFFRQFNKQHLFENSSSLFKKSIDNAKIFEIISSYGSVDSFNPSNTYSFLFQHCLDSIVSIFILNFIRILLLKRLSFNMKQIQKLLICHLNQNFLFPKKILAIKGDSLKN